MIPVTNIGYSEMLTNIPPEATNLETESQYIILKIRNHQVHNFRPTFTGRWSNGIRILEFTVQ